MGASVQQRVVGIILATTGMDSSVPVTAETELLHGGLSLDSALVLELLLAMEREFSVELDAKELFETNALRTVGSLSAFIEEKARGAG